MCVAVGVVVCVFAIEFQASTRLWLIHEISDVDADGIWLGVLLFLFAFTAVSFAQIWINNLVIRIKNYRKGEAWSITSLFSLCVFFSHISFSCFSRFYFLLLLLLFNNSNEAYNEIGYRIESVYERKHRKNFKMPNIQSCTYV